MHDCVCSQADWDESLDGHTQVHRLSSALCQQLGECRRFIAECLCLELNHVASLGHVDRARSDVVGLRLHGRSFSLEPLSEVGDQQLWHVHVGLQDNQSGLVGSLPIEEGVAQLINHLLDVFILHLLLDPVHDLWQHSVCGTAMPILIRICLLVLEDLADLNHCDRLVEVLLDFDTVDGDLSKLNLSLRRIELDGRSNDPLVHVHGLQHCLVQALSLDCKLKN